MKKLLLAFTLVLAMVVMVTLSFAQSDSCGDWWDEYWFTTQTLNVTLNMKGVVGSDLQPPKKVTLIFKTWGSYERFYHPNYGSCVSLFHIYHDLTETEIAALHSIGITADVHNLSIMMYTKADVSYFIDRVSEADESYTLVSPVIGNGRIDYELPEDWMELGKMFFDGKYKIAFKDLDPDADPLHRTFDPEILSFNFTGKLAGGADNLIIHGTFYGVLKPTKK